MLVVGWEVRLVKANGNLSLKDLRILHWRSTCSHQWHLYTVYTLKFPLVSTEEGCRALCHCDLAVTSVLQLKVTLGPNGDSLMLVSLSNTLAVILTLVSNRYPSTCLTTWPLKSYTHKDICTGHTQKTHPHTWARTQTRAHMRTYTHVHTHTRTHTRTHTHCLQSALNQAVKGNSNQCHPHQPNEVVVSGS